MGEIELVRLRSGDRPGWAPERGRMLWESGFMEGVRNFV
jgi:hypothetical protein